METVDFSIREANNKFKFVIFEIVKKQFFITVYFVPDPRFEDFDGKIIESGFKNSDFFWKPRFLQKKPYIVPMIIFLYVVFVLRTFPLLYNT